MFQCAGRARIIGYGTSVSLGAGPSGLMTPRARLWDRRIERAAELSKQHPAAAELLAFYQAIAHFQKNLQEKIGPATEHDLANLLPYFPSLIALVKQKGSAALRTAAAELEKNTRSEWIELLSAVWQHEPERKKLTHESVFFVNALMP